jgi:murein DD-endopeptidase MepM/ murein hydrolase activator NlpD
VLASGDGVVVFAGWSQYGYGNVVQIDHGNGFSTVYAHLSQINVSTCQAVYGGQVVGMAGTTGNSTGVHLHFEVREGGVNLNPWSIVH